MFSFVLADKGYDADKIIDYIYDHGGEPVIPPRANRLVQRYYDEELYTHRNVIERFFQRLKNFRRVATRYDKLPETFLGFIYMASICIWLK